jgi:peptidyl-prolyl cis-trans isomerase SurA
VTQNQLNEQISQIAQKNGMDLAQFKQALQQQGINYAQYRKRLHEQMTVQMMQQRAIAPKIQITDQQVQNFLQTYKNSPHSDSQFHVADIVVPLPDNPTPQAVAKAKKQADKITSRLKQGADFHQTAIARSSGVNALEGGDLGWNRLGELPDVFTHYLLKMQPGEVSGPIKAPNGYHVIKLVAVKHADTKLTKKNARQMLFRREFNRRLQAWLQELRGQAYIKTMLNGDGKDGQ